MFLAHLAQRHCHSFVFVVVCVHYFFPHILILFQEITRFIGANLVRTVVWIVLLIVYVIFVPFRDSM